MPRKVFISFLGTTDYFPSIYYRGKKFCSDMEKYVQIAALQYVQRSGIWTENDIAYVLLTTLAEDRNWKDNGYIDRNGNPNIGLETTIKNKNFLFPCRPIPNIPEGKNEKEIWQIFKIIHDLIQDGDELYFDITHGYRYLPMLVVVLGNYAKFLEKAKVVHILYGNYEGRDRDESGKYLEPPHSPIIDLQSLSTLQDWTYAVADFINNGNADKMSDLTYDASAPLIRKGQERADAINKLVTSIRNFAKDMQTCRGQSIVGGTNIKELQDDLLRMQDVLEQENGEVSVDQLLIPVFAKIQEMVKDYDDEKSIGNGFQAVNWCIEHKLYQQAITILQESVKNYFCLKLDYDLNDSILRKKIESMMNLANKRRITPRDLINEFPHPNMPDTWSMKMIEVAANYDVLRRLRNDVNHFGFDDWNPYPPSEIERIIKDEFDSIIHKLGICL